MGEHGGVTYGYGKNHIPRTKEEDVEINERLCAPDVLPSQG